MTSSVIAPFWFGIGNVFFFSFGNEPLMASLSSSSSSCPANNRVFKLLAWPIIYPSAACGLPPHRRRHLRLKRTMTTCYVPSLWNDDSRDTGSIIISHSANSQYLQCQGPIVLFNFWILIFVVVWFLSGGVVWGNGHQLRETDSINSDWNLNFTAKIIEFENFQMLIVDRIFMRNQEWQSKAFTAIGSFNVIARVFFVLCFSFSVRWKYFWDAEVRRRVWCF